MANGARLVGRDILPGLPPYLVDKRTGELVPVTEHLDQLAALTRVRRRAMRA